jgi:c-di-GMP-related signal transduction protein
MLSSIFDEASLRRGAARLLPPDRVIIEILENVAPTEEVVELCKDLCKAGYVLELDDFIGHGKWDVLIPLIKFLKVDFRAANSDTRREITQRFRGRGIQMLAEKVETQADLQEARSMGYTYFQGFFFCKPSMVAARDIPAKLNCLRILEAVALSPFSDDAVEGLLKNDPSLVYKLLRYLNSPLLGLRGEVRSICDAISLLGENEFRRWVSILAIVEMAADKPPELIRTALTRGFFCEAISHPIGIPAQSSDLLLMGLLSVTDAILDRPIGEILSNLPVSAEVRTALCGGANRFRDVYDTRLAYERRLGVCVFRRLPPRANRKLHPRLLPACGHASRISFLLTHFITNPSSVTRTKGCRCNPRSECPTRRSCGWGVDPTSAQTCHPEAYPTRVAEGPQPPNLAAAVSGKDAPHSGRSKPLLQTKTAQQVSPPRRPIVFVRLKTKQLPQLPRPQCNRRYAPTSRPRASSRSRSSPRAYTEPRSRHTLAASTPARSHREPARR